METVDGHGVNPEDDHGRERPSGQASGLVSARSLLIIVVAAGVGLFVGLGAGLAAGINAAGVGGSACGVAIGLVTGIGTAALISLSTAGALHALVGRTSD